MNTLRPYQQDCLDKLLWAKSLPGADLVSLPTGAGKSHVIAEYAKQTHGDVLILQPSRELVTQNMDKLSQIVPEGEIGVFSASLGRKEIKKYTFGTIGSVANHPELFNHFKTIIIDEAHLVNPKSLGSMYMTFFRTLGEGIKVVGLTATCYRLTPQYLRDEYGGIETITTIKLINRIKERFWSRLLFNINIGDLIDQDYLCPLSYYDQKLLTQENTAVNKSRSDFDLEKYSDQIADKEKKIIETVLLCEKHRKSVLVFCPSVEDATRWSSLTPKSEVVTAKTKKKDRTRIVDGFKDGTIKTVFNVGVLTTGFDHPQLDTIVLLRPTRSVGLLYQMVGRGVRKAEGKTSCAVIDMTDTIRKIGRIETIRLEKVDGKWELITEKGSWHGKSLYSFKINV